MTIESVLEIIYTVSAGVVFLVGAQMYFRKPSPLFVRMIVCVMGCRFLQGLMELLLVREGVDLNGFTLSTLGAIAQFLFLICANYGPIDSLCDDGSKKFMKYRLLAAILPVVIFVVSIFFVHQVADTTASVIMHLVGMLIPLFALYYHIKHLIIKDVEWGVLKNIRLYNLIGVLNCHCFIASWLNDSGSLIWKISMVLYIFVTFTMLPALVHGANKWKSV